LKKWLSELLFGAIRAHDLQDFGPFSHAFRGFRAGPGNDGASIEGSLRYS